MKEGKVKVEVRALASDIPQSACRKIVVLDQAQNSLRNLPATSNSRLNFVGVIFWLITNQPQVNYGEPMHNGFTQYAIVE